MGRWGGGVGGVLIRGRCLSLVLNLFIQNSEFNPEKEDPEVIPIKGPPT